MWVSFFVLTITQERQSRWSAISIEWISKKCVGYLSWVCIYMVRVRHGVCVCVWCYNVCACNISTVILLPVYNFRLKLWLQFVVYKLQPVHPCSESNIAYQWMNTVARHFFVWSTRHEKVTILFAKMAIHQSICVKQTYKNHVHPTTTTKTCSPILNRQTFIYMVRQCIH